MVMRVASHNTIYTVRFLQATQGTQRVSGGGHQARISQQGGHQANAGGRQYSNGQLKNEGVNHKNQ